MTVVDIPKEAYFFVPPGLL